MYVLITVRRRRDVEFYDVRVIDAHGSFPEQDFTSIPPLSIPITPYASSVLGKSEDGKTATTHSRNI